MNPINQTSASPYTQLYLSSQSAETRASPATQQSKVSEANDTKAAGQVSATQQTDVTVSGPDLTDITPDEVTKLAAGMFEAGTIDIMQMAGLFAIAAQQQFPPKPGGGFDGAVANNEPFNLLEVVADKPHHRQTERGQDRSLLEILSGLQNSLEVEQRSSIDIQV